MRPNLSYSLRETGPMVCLIRVPSMRMLKPLPISPSNCGLSLRPRKVRLDGMNRRARQVFIDRLQIRLLAEDDISGVFALVYAPVVSGSEVPIDRAAAPGELVEPCVN